MKNDEIDKLEAGCEFDALVAKYIFGQEEFEHEFNDFTKGGDCKRCDASMDMGAIRGPKKCPVPPEYSTDDGLAYQVLRHCRVKHVWQIGITIEPEGGATVFIRDHLGNFLAVEYDDSFSRAANAAALKAVSGGEQ